MLIMTRRIGERLIIDDDIVVTVVDVQGNQIRLGVDAPRDKAVHREEVYQRLQRAKSTAQFEENSNTKARRHL